MYTYIMERTQIYLTKAEASALDREAQRTGRTRSNLIREAIDERYVAAGAGDALRDALDASFGAWRGRAETGAEYVERIRARNRLAELWDDATPDDLDAGATPVE